MNKRVLVAGIGNIFLGDDGFGVEVARRLAGRGLPKWVEVRDYGIRGMDLAYDLLEERDAVIFVDAMPGGKKPGAVTVLEAEAPENETSPDTHAMTPEKVLALAKTLGAKKTKILVVGCEPETAISEENYEDILVELSDPVEKAVDEAVEIVETLVGEIEKNGAARKGGETK